jgi:hypothetical protein
MIWLCCVLPGGGLAQNGSLFGKHARPSPLFAVSAPSEARLTTASLFAGQSENSLFAPLPDRVRPASPRRGASLPDPVMRLLDLIALAEAGPADYNAVQHGARIKPALPATQMTLGEIFDWIKATPRQPHAIGRYQFIPATLRRLVNIKGYGRDTRFSPDVQDQLAMILLQEAGLDAFLARTLPHRAFMKNLARIWAGLPLPNGRSYYQGYAGNKATMSYARFEAGVRAMF